MVKLHIMRPELKHHMYIPMALSSSTCIMLSEGPESSDIDSDQVWIVTMFLIIHVLTVTIGKSLKHFGEKMKHNWS